METILFAFSGLPASGKSTLAKHIAKTYRAVYLRIDTIEQSLLDLCQFKVQGEGYELSYRIASDNLKLGNNVVSDSCNPINLTREAWENLALLNGCRCINIEVICSDEVEHQKRLKERVNEVENLKVLSWGEVVGKEYHSWTEDRIIIETAHKSITSCVDELVDKIELLLNDTY